MSKYSIPDSLELLLDTMCNTFGGVMFITLSLVLILSLSQNLLKQNNIPRDPTDELRRVTAENASIQARIQSLQRRISSFHEALPQLSDEQLQQLQQLADAQEQLHSLQQQNADLQTSLQQEQQNLDNQQRIRQNANNLTQQISALRKSLQESTARNQKLEEELQKLQETIQNTAPVTIRFARDEKTSQTPYWMIVQNNALYRIGQTGDFNRTETTIQENNDILKITPRPNHGHALRNLTKKQAESLLEPLGFTYFAAFFVHPDSLASFTRLRRHCRALGYSAKWTIASEYQLRLSSGHDFSASE